MKLHQLVAKPQLTEVKIDDAETVAKYGEVITFHTWDRQPMDVFMKLASATENNIGNILTIVKDLILDENGVAILKDGEMLPTDILMKAVARVTDILGK